MLNKSSIDYKEYENVINLYALKVMRRVNAMKLDLTMDDVRQELCVGFTQARNAFKPEKGYKFSTYLRNSIFSSVNDRIEKLAKESTIVCSNAVYDASLMWEDPFERLDEKYSHEFESSYEDTVSSTEEMFERVNSLSVLTRSIVIELIEPSELLVRQHKEDFKSYEEKIKKGEALRNIIPAQINLSYVFKYYGLNKKEIAEVKAEFKEVLGVEL